MKRFLQGLLGVIAVVGLAIAVIGLVRNAPAVTPQSTQVSNTPTNPVPTDTLDTVSAPIPTEEIISLDFESLGVISAETVQNNVPPYPLLSWSPDGNRATFGREMSCHILHADERTATARPFHPYDLWVYDRITGQEYKLADAAGRRGWSPDGTAIVYEAP